MVIKIFIGHFTWLHDNPYVFAGDPAQVGEGGVMVLEGVDSTGRRREGEPGERSGTRRCWAVLADGARLRSPDQSWSGCSGIPSPAVGEAPASYAPSLNRSGDFRGPSCWPCFDKVKVKAGRGGFGAEEIAAP